MPLHLGLMPGFAPEDKDLCHRITPSLLQAVGSAPLCPEDDLDVGIENWRAILVSVCQRRQLQEE